MKKFVTMALSAALMATLALGFSSTAYAEDNHLTVKGEVVLVGGSGNVEDVKLTIKYGNVPAGYEDGYMGTVRWYGNPDAEGKFSIPTEASKGGLHLLRVTAELDGYSSDYDVLTFGEDTTQRLILNSKGTPSSVVISGQIRWEDGNALPGNICPIVTISMNDVVGVSTIKACAGHWNCNAMPGKDVVVTPELEGYEFTPSSITVKAIAEENRAINFVIRPVGSKKEEKAAETEAVTETTAAVEEETAGTEAAETETNDEALAVFYADSNYRGKSISLGVGKYNMNQLGNLGNDKLSSVKVPAGYKVTLYQHDKFGGRALECTEDISFLGGSYRFNDQTSSIIITRE